MIRGPPHDHPRRPPPHRTSGADPRARNGFAQRARMLREVGAGTHLAVTRRNVGTINRLLRHESGTWTTQIRKIDEKDACARVLLKHLDLPLIQDAHPEDTKDRYDD